MRISRWCTYVAVLTSAACSSDASFAPVLSGADVYWSLRLNHHAVQLSLHPPHNTLKLETTMYTSSGSVFTSTATTDERAITESTVFVSRDSTKVGVAQDGTLSARAIQGGAVFVVATKTFNGVSHSDSALVRVADISSSPVLNAFTVRPAVGDSAKVAVAWPDVGFNAGRKGLPVSMKDTAGLVLGGYAVYLSSSDPLIASVGTNPWVAAKQVTAVRPGKVKIRAELWVYGVAMTDSFTFTVGYPINSTISRFFPIDQAGYLVRNHFDVGPGAIVSWENVTARTAISVQGLGGVISNGQPVDIIFDDPINVLEASTGGVNTGSGNIIAIPSDSSLAFTDRVRYRRFLTPGTYPFRVMPFGTTGTVVVK